MERKIEQHFKTSRVFRLCSVEPQGSAELLWDCVRKQTCGFPKQRASVPLHAQPQQLLLISIMFIGFSHLILVGERFLW